MDKGARAWLVGGIVAATAAATGGAWWWWSWRQRPHARDTTTTRPSDHDPPKGRPLEDGDASTLPPKDAAAEPDIEPDDESLQATVWTSWAVKAPIEARAMDFPTGGPWVVEVLAMAPDVDGGVRFPAKLGHDEFGYAAGPDGSAPVLEAVLGKVTDAARAVAPAAGAAAQAYGVPPGVVEAAIAAASKLIEAIPDALERSRVSIWNRWREGQYGNAAERARVREEVERWRDVNWSIAIRKGWLCQYWRFEATPKDTGQTEFALVADEFPPHTGGGKSLIRQKPCASSAPPLVWAEGVTDGWARLFVRLEPNPGGASERRYSIVANRK